MVVIFNPSLLNLSIEILHNKCPGSAQHDLMKKGNFISRFFLSIYIK